MSERKYVVGRACPVPGHDHVLRLGSTARDNGGYVACTVRERERTATWKELHRPRRKYVRRPREDDEVTGPAPAPDPTWDGAQACALAVAEDAGLFAACVVAPLRYAVREEALAEAERALRDVRSARARAR